MPIDEPRLLDELAASNSGVVTMVVVLVVEEVVLMLVVVKVTAIWSPPLFFPLTFPPGTVVVGVIVVVVESGDCKIQTFRKRTRFPSDAAGTLMPPTLYTLKWTRLAQSVVLPLSMCRSSSGKWTVFHPGLH